jgi:hypothetical protein
LGALPNDNEAVVIFVFAKKICHFRASNVVYLRRDGKELSWRPGLYRLKLYAKRPVIVT